MTRRDKWAERRCVIRYRGYKDMLRYLGASVPECAQVVFVLPMPQARKQRDLLRGYPHQRRPDLDNLVKGLLDALYEDDAHFWSLSASKVWGDTGAIYVRAIERPELPL